MATFKKSKKQFPFFPLLILVTIFLLTIVFLEPKSNKTPGFSEEISNCNLAKTVSRFSCYRTAIEKFFVIDVQKFSRVIKNDKTLSFESRFVTNGEITYAIFGTNCHTFYHAAGDFVATYAPTQDLNELLGLGVPNCTAAYTMGLYKRTALKKSFHSDLLKKFISSCPEGQQNQCAHEVGHLLHDKYTYALLKVIDSITEEKYGLKSNQEYQYVTFPNKKADIEAPFEECEEIIPKDKPNLVAQCFTGIGHNMFIFAEFAQDGYTSQFKDCEGILENRNNCYGFLLYRIGINEAATKFLSRNFDRGNKVCEDAIKQIKRQDLMHHCYLGIGGGIGLWVDSDYSARKIDSDNLSQIKREMLDFAVLCDQTPDAYRDKCYSGLMGTKFKKFYIDLGISHPKIEKLIPTLDSDFEVVG